MARILVVDDEPSAVGALTTLLNLDGHVTVPLESGSRALELLATDSFDVVITDLEMPGTSGIEIIRAARRIRTPPLVVVVTGYTGSPAAEVALASGARRIFGKPLNYDALASELASGLAEKGETSPGVL